MGEIRSALDIALEKTENIKADKGAVENEKIKNSGKKAAAFFLDGENFKDFAAECEKIPKNDKLKFIEGALSIFCAAVKLPENEEGASMPLLLAKGFKAMLPHSNIESLFTQANLIFRQYLEEKDTLLSTLERQFTPRLKAKEDELSKLYGQKVSLSLEQDAEYNAALLRAVNSLQSQYNPVVNEIKGKMREAANLEGVE